MGEARDLYEAANSADLESLRGILLRYRFDEKEKGEAFRAACTRIYYGFFIKDQVVVQISVPEAVKCASMLFDGADTNVQGYENMTALMCLCRRNENNDAVVDLVRQVATKWSTNLDLRDKYGKTSLLDACALHVKSQALKIVLILIKNGADVNVQDQEGNTPILLACKAGNFDAVIALAENGANINAKDKDGSTCLWLVHHSVRDDEEEKFYRISVLIKYGADVNIKFTENETTILMESTVDVSLVGLLIESGAEINASTTHGSTALLEACFHKNVDSVRLLVENGADVNLRNHGDWTPLSTLIYDRRCYPEEMTPEVKDCAAFLIEHGAEVNVLIPFIEGYNFFGDEIPPQEERYLSFGVLQSLRMREDDDPSLISQLIEKGALCVNETFQNNSLLYHAILIGFLKIATTLVDHEADVNLQNNRGDTALMLAAEHGSSETATMLVERGHADVNLQNNRGDTALMLAAKRGSSETATMLVERGHADVNLQNKYKDNALLYACDSNFDLVKLLVRYGAKVDLNLQGSCGRTLLMESCKYANSIEEVQYLLQHSSSESFDVNLQDAFGSTALMEACYVMTQSHVEISMLLITLGASVNAIGEHFTILSTACKQGFDIENQLQFLEFLLNQGADANAQSRSGDNTALISACSYADPHLLLQIVSLLLEHDADPSKHTDSGYTVLMALCGSHNVSSCDDVLEVTSLLLEHGADARGKTKQGETALMLLCDTFSSQLSYGRVENHYHLASVLIDHGVDVNETDEYGRTAFEYLPFGYIEDPALLEFVTILVEKGRADTGLPFVFDYGIDNCPELAIMILEKGKTGFLEGMNISISAICDSYESPSLKLVELLVEKSPRSLDITKNNHMTALMCCAYRGHLEIATFLVEKVHVNVNRVDCWGNSALIIACCEKKYALASLLIVKGHAEVNTRNEEGKTALMMTISHSQSDIAELLISSGADIAISNNSRDTVGNMIRNYSTPASKFLKFYTRSEVALYLLQDLRLSPKVVITFYHEDAVTPADCSLLDENDLKDFGIASRVHRRKFLRKFRHIPARKSSLIERMRSSLRFSFLFDVFLTHDWGENGTNHELVRTINNKLSENGVNTWFDGERLSGEIAEQISRAVRQSRKIVVFITRRYMEKLNSTEEDWCKEEFMSATRKRGAKNMIPVILESDMLDSSKWIGPLELKLGGRLFVDFTTSENRAMNFNFLLEQINKKV